MVSGKRKKHNNTTEVALSARKKKSLGRRMREQKYLLILLIPCLLYYIIFKYIPMAGVLLAFKRFDFRKGIFGSPWVGLKYFKQFVHGPFFGRLIKNTFLLSFYELIFGFPIPIIFALFLNEIKNDKFKKTVQTISYLPHFVSVVIVVGLMKQMFSPTTGIVNRIIEMMGGEPINFFMQKEWFRTLYVGSGIWQGFGWSAIIYIASIASIDQQIYEAARVDGAGRFRCMWNITLPGISPTIIILLILRIGKILEVGYEKVLLMYNPGTYETADIISTYIYRAGIEKTNYSLGTAVGLMNAVVSFVLIIFTNRLSQKVSDVGLW